MEKYINFFVLIKKEIERIGKNREETTKNISSISYKLQSIISAKFLASSLSNLTDNLAERIHKIKRKCGHDNKNVKLNTNILIANLNMQTLKMIYFQTNVYTVAGIIKKALMKT